MRPTENNSFNATRWFYIFIILHLILWTAVPAYIRTNLPLDAIEGTIWAHQLEWGYDKNPFMNGWLTAVAIHLGGPSGWMIYLFSQLFIVAAFFSVWQIAKNILTPPLALISVMLLELVQYYNFHSLDFNDNTIELGLWALTMLYLYQATKTEATSLRDWLLTATFAALALMTKYYTLALLAAMSLFLILNPQNRKELTKPTPYLGLILFLAIITPHINWLFSHDFITVRYVFHRAASAPSWTNYFFFPLEFAWQQLQVFLPALVVGALLCLPRKKEPTTKIQLFLSFDKQFLFYIGLGPFLLNRLIIPIHRHQVTRRLGHAITISLGRHFNRLASTATQQNKNLCLYLRHFYLNDRHEIGYIYSLVDSPDPSSANFPGN